VSRSIIIESVSLAGFGPYKGPVRAAFPRGLGVWAGPNEQGKSTLAAGVVAVLFGLPQAADPSGFTTGRYRHWDGPAEFWGEVTLCVGDDRFRVRRNFDNHRISLCRQAESGWIEEVVGEHNPVGRKPNRAYTDWLFSLFHHTSRELFQSTFCVVQPIPHAEKLDAELKALLAGAGGGGHEPALDHLVKAARALTMETKSLGLTPRDGRTPGELDQLALEIEALKEAIEASGQTVSGLQEVAARIAELNGTLDERREKLHRVRKSVQAYQTWREHAQNVQRLADEIRRLSRSKEAYARLETELERARQEQRRVYPELLDAPAEFGDGLARLEELFALEREVDRLAKEAERLAVRCGSLQEEVRALALPIPRGENAVSWARALARDLQEATQVWDEFQSLRGRLKAIENRLDQEYAVFEEAAPAVLAAVESYDELARWQAELERLESELKRADEAAREAEAARERLEARYPGAARHAAQRETIATLIELSKRADEIKGRSEELRARRRRTDLWTKAAAWMGAVLGVIGILGEWVPFWALGLAMIASALLARVLPAARRLEAAIASCDQQLGALEERRVEIAGEAAELAGFSTEELEALRDEIRQFSESLELIRPLEEKVPAPEERRRMEEALAAIRERMQGLEDAVSAPKAAFDDFQAAYRAWQELREEKEGVEAALERMLAAWGLPSVAPQDVEQAPLRGEGTENRFELKGVWQRLLKELPLLLDSRALTGVKPGSIQRFGDLAAGAAWALETAETLFERAREHDRLMEEIARLESERNLLLAPGASGVIRRHLDRARDLCQGLAGQFGGDWEKVWEGMARSAQQPEENFSPEAFLERLPPLFRDALAAGGGVDGARRRWQAYRELEEAAQNAEREMASILKAYDCRDFAQLESRFIVAEARLKNELQAMRRLAEEFPSLPSPEDQGANAKIDERLAGLVQEERSLEQEIDALEDELTQLTLRQAELQGATPMNIAAAELTLQSLCDRHERLRLELEAICLAYHELAQAAAEFYDSHLGRLEERASHYFRAVSKRTGRRVSLDGDLRVIALEPDGKRVLPAQLSQGARDQLYLSLRFAVGDLLSGEYIAPYLLDDPFVNCDEERLEAIRTSLVELARERQILLFTHRRDLAEWGEAIVLKQGAQGGKTD